VAEDLLKSFTLDVDTINENNKNVTPLFSQGDVKTAILVINIKERNVALDLTGMKVKAAFKKPDNTSVFQDETNGVSILDRTGGKIQVVLTSQAISARGNVRGQISITDPTGGLVAETTEFTFYVRESIVNSSIISSNELPIIEQIIDLWESGGVGGGGGSLPANAILFEDWTGGESVTIDTSTAPADTTAPTLSITAGGTFTGTKTVTMSANETATIYYTLNGSEPTTSSSIYSGPLSISATTTLKAFARDSAGNSSAIQTIVYTLDATAPTDTTPPANITDITFSNVAQTGVTLTWAAVSDAVSYDILRNDSLVGNVTGTTYNATGLTASTAYTFTVKPKDAANNTASGYSEQVTTAAPPADTTAPILTITPAATFTDTQTVNMSADETATIWYTVDGTDPKTSGTKVQYTTPVTLTATTTLKAYAVDSANNESAVQTVTYTKETIQGPAEITTANMILHLDGTDQTTVQGAGVQSSTVTWQDKSGAGNHMTLPPNGASTIPLSLWNTASGFTPDGNVLNMRLPFNNFNDYPMTWEFIVKVPAGVASELIKIGASNPNYIMKYRGDVTTTSSAGRLFLTKAGTSGNYIEVDVPNTTDLTKYVQFVYVVESNNLKAYCNGVLLQNVTATMPAIVDNLASGYADFQNPKNTMKTKVIRAYNRALTTEEILNNYNAQIALY
jgi:BppU N-terminal domain/Chitobiase/beta-hexosaminidase C-terminal domain